MGNLKGVQQPRIAKSKKRIIITVVVAVLAIMLAIGGLWFSGANAWQSIADAATRDKAAAWQARQTVITASSREERHKAIAQLVDISYRSDRCRGAWWYAWQQDISEAAKAAKNRCESANRSLEVINKASTVLKRYLDAEKLIETQLASLKIDSTTPSWQTVAADSAAKVLVALKSQKAQGNADVVRKEAVKRVEGVTVAWKTLQDADKKKDKSAYQTAVTALGDAYAGISAISDVSDEQIKTLVNDLSTVD